uniref:NADH dehydrogenase subunit 4L n=1 Tax=Leptomyrmex pallens TaxID=611136 RepID=V5JEW1_9HYME|nr:NADH dehydrogenase subunit 4L [Leptomyrmex pallens]AGL61400.1 NADH dehydrogenase subunit 4L [Leptomyrmex pallens]
MFFDIMFYFQVFFMVMVLFTLLFKHILMVLMVFEVAVMTVGVMMFFVNSLVGLEFFVIFYMVFSVCESVLGIALLVLIVRKSGDDMYFSFNMSKF